MKFDEQLSNGKYIELFYFCYSARLCEDPVAYERANALNANDLVHFCFSSHRRSVYGLHNTLILLWNCWADVSDMNYNCL